MLHVLEIVANKDVDTQTDKIKWSERCPRVFLNKIKYLYDKKNYMSYRVTTKYDNFVGTDGQTDGQSDYYMATRISYRALISTKELATILCCV